jgi:hypothetical protein
MDMRPAITAIDITIMSPNREALATGLALLVVRYDGFVPGAEDGAEPEFVCCGF